MSRRQMNLTLSTCAALLAVLPGSLVISAVPAAATRAPNGALAEAATRYIIEGPTVVEARRSVALVGGQAEQDLDIIHGVVATLNPWRAQQLRANPKIRIYRDRSVVTEGLAAVVAAKSAATPLVDGTIVSTPAKWLQTDYTMEVGADSLHVAGTTGKGVTIAMLDTGLWNDPSQNYKSRVLATIDVRNGGSAPVATDPYGHGTHITSIAAGGFRNMAGGFFGIAPQANLVIVRAFDDVGGGS